MLDGSKSGRVLLVVCNVLNSDFDLIEHLINECMVTRNTNLVICNCYILLSLIEGERQSENYPFLHQIKIRSINDSRNTVRIIYHIPKLSKL